MDIILRRNLELCVLFQLRSGGCGIHVTRWELGQEWFSGSLEKVCRMLALKREVVLHVVARRSEGYSECRCNGSASSDEYTRLQYASFQHDRQLTSLCPLSFTASCTLLHFLSLLLGEFPLPPSTVLFSPFFCRESSTSLCIGRLRMTVASCSALHSEQNTASTSTVPRETRPSSISVDHPPDTLPKILVEPDWSM